MKAVKRKTIKNPDVVIKLTEAEAIYFGIDITKDQNKAEYKTVGPWNVIKSYEALCISGVFQKNPYTKLTEITLYGKRKLSKPVQAGYHLEGHVSIKNKRTSAFTSSKSFEVNGKLIDCEVIFARTSFN